MISKGSLPEIGDVHQFSVININNTNYIIIYKEEGGDDEVNSDYGPTRKTSHKRQQKSTNRQEAINKKQQKTP